MDREKDGKNKNDNKDLINKDKIAVLIKDDAEYYYIYKKTEKIAAAVYLVTNIISDTEPLRGSLRTIVLDLNTKIVGLKYIPGSATVHEEIKSVVLEVSSLFEIGVRSGIISPMNWSIIKFELEGVLEIIEQRMKGSARFDYPLSNFFQSNEFLPERGYRTIKDNKQTDVFYNSSSTNVQKTPLQTRMDKKDNTGTRDERRQKIISMLKAKDNLTIKDFSSVITDCSEKTVQRILLAMVAEGVLKKEGERRWSTYSLNGNNVRA